MDSYEAAIDNSSELSDMERLTYLRSYLTDVALKLISGLSLANDNCWKTVITTVIVLLRMIILYLKVFEAPRLECTVDQRKGPKLV